MLRTSANHNNIYLFLATAETLSFTEAGKKFGITQGAVSYRIKQLEDEIGSKLFIRQIRRIVLTPEGKQLYVAVKHSYKVIDNVISDLKDPTPTGELRIGASPSFASRVLIPALPSFLEQYPQMNVRVVTSSVSQTFNDESMDLAIVYADRVSEFHTEPVIRESIVPICSPAYARKHKLLFTNQTLSELTLIDNVNSSNWMQWLNNSDYVASNNNRFLVDNFHSTLSAATSGIGLAIGRWTLVKDLILSGELVAPYQAVLTNKHYWLVSVRGMEHRASYKLFASWVNSKVFGKNAEATSKIPHR
ncbi:LysR substrate-binding domain-containing protein [Vibrio artabrorum]|uniref:LysR substrate-binding domain-containing protein n=1 Tax=Vibrio artabrorum TaxID=446374 RepID=A0ABT8CJP1_9VIBR|nr:LysR substrate-binding domain-containing protein [Vibrio artabrorum]MDN3701550.1 LysR substrate-binding domain-containing protein [Vibrio artabrorum]